MRGADVFVGLSKGNVVSADMVRSMAERPIIFALANPRARNHLRGGQKPPAPKCS